MKCFSEENIGKLSFMGSVAFILLFTCLLGGYRVFSGYKELDADIHFMEKKFQEQQREQLKTSVNHQIFRIEIRQDLIIQELKKVLKTRTRNILGVIENLHKQYNKGKSTEEIQQFIRDSIRPLSFHGGNSYVFIFSMDGVPQLYPPDPSLEGKIPDWQVFPNQQKVVDGLTKIVREKGEGFYEYQWPKSDDNLDKLYKKICFVSYFEPYNWLIGIGEYLDYFTLKTQKGIEKVLSQSNTSFLGSYFFLYQLHDIQGGDDFATMLVNSNRPDLVGAKLSDSYTDVTGRPFRKEMLKGLREKGEAYVEYQYKKPGTEKISRKLSYFKLYPKWNWVVARGVYFDDLENSIALKKKQLAEQMQHELLVFLFLLAGALVGALLFARFFSKGITSIFEQYKEKQQSLQNELQNSHNKLELLVQERTAELEQSHAQLLHAGKLAAIGSFSASIAHEFNNPLTGVLNVLARLQRTIALKDNDAQLLTMALNECERMKRLIQDLQSFNRPSSGKKDIFVLEKAIESILLLSKKELTKRQIMVETHFSPEPTLVNGVEDQIRQVLLNLIKNGMDALPVAGGILSISTMQEQQIATISIHDNGCGIKTEHLDKIFDPFFTTKSTMKGTGLGLSVSHGIIRSHGGDISASSEPDKGTTFTITLPIQTTQKEHVYDSPQNTTH